MTLAFKHFDTRLNQWIESENLQIASEPILTEKLDNTLLELYFPDQQFSFGRIDEKSTLNDLYQHPDGHVLLLSSSSRLLYGPRECLETIEKLCPDRKDRGAYGSIFLGSCQNAIFKEMNVLVVDDASGENGEILPNQIAWRQVGDCHGKISTTLATELSGTIEHVIQHRLGIPDQFRFAKGTLAPKDLSQLPYKKTNTNIDLIIPTSSFKGGDKKNNPIRAGLHKLKVWIGEKERSHPGKIATSQIHASFPDGIKDYVKDLSEGAKELQKLQNEPRLLAESYCYKYEKRQEASSLKKIPARDSSTENESDFFENDSEPTETDQQNNDLMYRLIKADLEAGHGQLLETQKVTSELSRFLRKEWLDISIGKSITFDRGMIIPSKDLKHGEICVSWLDEGEEVLNFRSPLLNSNGMCVSLNKHVKDTFAPNGEPLKGVIVVNDEDHKRITARIKALKTQGIATDEIDPLETESERQGRDYDGDCIGVAPAKNFPNLTAEAKQRNQSENAYAPAKKEEKVSFYRSDGSQPPFEEIALFMSDSVSVGVINNHATALEALESEIDILRKYGTYEQKGDYVRLVGSHYQKLINQENDFHSPKPLPPQYRSRIAQIAKIAQSSLTPETINAALAINRSIYHEMIGEAGYQNQLAVDIFKSNRAPDMDAIAKNNRLLHRIPNYIRDKKNPRMYINKGIEPQGFSPVELMVRQANTHFSESTLVARPTEQFRDLFAENYTPAQYNQAILAKAEFDKLFNAASIANQKLRHETGPVLKVSTTSGKQLEITNLTKFNHPQAFSAKKLNLKLVENKTPGAYHKLLALAQVNGQVDEKGNPIYQKLGTVCEISRGLEGLQSGMTTELANVQLASPVTKRQVQLKFQQAYDYAESFANNIPDSERGVMAAATWHVCTTPDNQKNANNSQKISNLAFAAFGNEIIGQLKELQFTNFVAAELRQHNETPDELWRNVRDVSLFVKAHEDKRFWFVGDPTTETDYKLGVLSPKGAQLPVGTRAKGKITGDAIATANLSIPGIEQPITFGKMGEHEFSTRQFNGESVKVTLKPITPPAKPILKLSGKEIGELDSRSVEMLATVNRLKEGQLLDVTLNTLGFESGTYTLATTALGNTIRVNRQAFAAHQNQRFAGESTTVEVGFKQSAPAMGVMLDVDGTTKLAGIFTTNQKASKEALMKAGLWQDGATFEATINSNITIAKVTIDPNSIKYPEMGQWISPERDRLFQEPTSVEKAADTYLKALKKQPSLLHRLDQDWTLPDGSIQKISTLGLAVDESVADATSQWLTSQKVPHVRGEPTEPTIKPETARGYTVFRMKEADVSPNVLQLMQKQCGEVLDAVAVEKAAITKDRQQISHNTKPNAIANPNTFTSPPLSPTSRVKETSSTPIEIQLSRTKIIAPIVKDYLDLANTHHHSGSIHTATWDKNSQILSLVDNRTNCLKLLAKWDSERWSALPVPLADSKSPNLTEADVTHFQSLVPKIEASWDKRRAQYRTWYNSSAFEILSSVKSSQPSPEQLDLAIAISVLTSSQDHNDVGKVLSQSDTVLAMKATLSPAEYQTQMTEYIKGIYQQAFEKIQNLELKKNDLER
jgi:hypothetical protein